MFIYLIKFAFKVYKTNSVKPTGNPLNPQVSVTKSKAFYLSYFKAIAFYLF